MRTLLIALTLGLALAPQLSVAKAKKAAKPKAKIEARKLETNVRFDDSSLYGKYQVPDEALAKVENEKVLQNVLGVRKHFKDRLVEASEQE